MAPPKRKSNKKLKPIEILSSRRGRRKKTKISWFSATIKWCFVAGIWGSIFMILLLGWYGAELPKLTQKADFERRATLTIKAYDGTIISRYGDLKGNTVALSDLPPHIPQAVIAIEDRRFYSHFGIDPIGLARALVTNLTGGRGLQGGSTITQQLAKNLFLSHERTLKRKIQEAMLALWLEHELSKDEILSAYLNRVYLGSGTYGFDAASRRFFGKPASETSLFEAAMLAGLLKAPSHYSPIYAPEASRKRAKIVLRAMAREGFITESQLLNARDVMITTPAPLPDDIKQARYFTDWVISALDDLIEDNNDDLVIETTLHADIQKLAEHKLSESLDANQERAVTQGAALILDHNGGVIAMVGGKDYRTSQFNRISQAKRQPGSSFKPFIYLTALQRGWQPSSLILDAPFDDRYDYRPSNFSDKYYGEVSLTDALSHSLNTASVRLMQQTGGPQATIETARTLGIHSNLAPDLSLALGSSAVSLQELSAAYAGIANGGHPVTPYAITRISDGEGILYYDRSSPPKKKRAFKKQAIEFINDMLHTVVQDGTGHNANITGYNIHGKTGTSQNYRDAWFMGYNDDLVAGIWVGNDDNTPMDHVTGGAIPARLWKNIMSEAIPLYRAQSHKGLTHDDFGTLLKRLLPITPEIKRPDYNLNE